MNVAEQTFVIWTAYFVQESTGRRYTNMRYWETVVDSWLSGGGRQPAGARDNLRYIGINSIIEKGSLKAIEDEIELQTSEGTNTTPSSPAGNAVIEIEITSDSPYWKDNLWISCCERVAAGLSTSGKTVAVSTVWIQKDRIGDFHMVVELAAS